MSYFRGKSLDRKNNRILEQEGALEIAGENLLYPWRRRPRLKDVSICPSSDHGCLEGGWLICWWTLNWGRGIFFLMEGSKTSWDNRSHFLVTLWHNHPSSGILTFLPGVEGEKQHSFLLWSQTSGQPQDFPTHSCKTSLIPPVYLIKVVSSIYSGLKMKNL